MSAGFEEHQATRASSVVPGNEVLTLCLDEKQMSFDLCFSEADVPVMATQQRFRLACKRMLRFLDPMHQTYASMGGKLWIDNGAQKM